MGDSKRESSAVSAEAKAIGRKLRKARKAAKLSVAETARRAEVSKNHLYVLERGEMMPSIPTLGRLAKVLGVSNEFLRVKGNGNGESNSGRRS